MRVRVATNTTLHLRPTHSVDLPRPSSRLETHLTSIVRQFVSQLGDWWQPANTVEQQEEISAEEITQELQNEFGEATVADLNLESVQDLSQAGRPNIWKFLQPVSSEEIKKSRFMASLSNASYTLSKFTNLSFLAKYGLHLVASSLKYKEPAKRAKLVQNAVMTGDGMAVAKADIPRTEKPTGSTQFEMSNIVTLPTSATTLAKLPEVKPVKPRRWTLLARQVILAGSVSRSAVSETLTRVVSLLQAALRPSPGNLPFSSSSFFGERTQGSKEGDGSAMPSKVINKCPTEWFVCDDENKETRIFCIQGSDSFESWQTNLALDPVTFEEENLGVRVHRGVYEAALSLYDYFVPLIRDHVKSGLNKKISFTGHSLGGAIATVLLMILVHRGVLSPENVDQVFTFGGAACFCDTDDCSACACNAHSSSEQSPTSPCSMNRNLLEKLGLSTNTVVNVIMHKDIVPRAFACDYSLVAEFLRKWSTSFRKHHCLAVSGRALLYNFIGEILILQPHADSHFVNNEGYHPMLPPQSGLFKLKDPDNYSLVYKDSMEMEAMRESDEVRDKTEAFLALMDNPHPLNILSEAKAYGISGTISRYHNPRHYALGLRSVIHKKTLQTAEKAAF